MPEEQDVAGSGRWIAAANSACRETWWECVRNMAKKVSVRFGQGVPEEDGAEEEPEQEGVDGVCKTTSVLT